MLGRGGAGVVYECLDPDLDRSVAIKNLLPAEDAEGEEHLRRFKGEAQALARLAHPNIVRIYDYDDRSEDFPFIVMEFVEGGSLRQVLDPDHPMAPAQAVRLVRQVLAGLAATHKIGVIHRDIKPGNILMRGDLPLIADFGIARIADKRSTMVGTVIGTAHYMAPEQLLGGEIDHRADIWSTGVLLYQMLTGHQPFDGANALVIMEAIRNTNPVPPSDHCLPGLIPVALDRVVLKSLAKRPSDRYASADEFSAALEEAIRAPAEVERTIVMPPTATVSPSNPRRKTSPVPWIAAGGGVAVLAGIGVAVVLLSRTPTPEPIPGPAETLVAITQETPQVPAITSPTEAAPAAQPPPPASSVPAEPAARPAEPQREQASPPATVPPATVMPPAAEAPPPPQVIAAPPTLPAVIPPASPPLEVTPPAEPPRPRLADLRDLVDTADCAVIGGTLEPGRLVLTGLGAVDVVAPLRDLWSALRAAGPAGGGSRFDVSGMVRNAGLCQTLGLLRPFSAPLGTTRRPVSIRLDAKGPRLRPDVEFSLAVALADFAGWVQVDYFSFADNAVLHVGLLSPRQRRPPTPLPHAIQLGANEQATVFTGAAGSAGEDMVVAIVSRERLFAQPRPEIEDVQDYLTALRAALASRPAAAVAVHVIPVIIQPAP
jgi:serine/threonine-protein kinase